MAQMVYDVNDVKSINNKFSDAVSVITLPKVFLDFELPIMLECLPAEVSARTDSSLFQSTRLRNACIVSLHMQWGQ